jgi:hypothetical protein
MTRRLTASLLNRPGNPGTKGKLLAKSVEAYLLALETINRLTITYRTETFCTLMCNAWELLLKAKMLEDSGQRTVIWYPVKVGERRRSLSLRDALKSVYPDERDSVRRNIERVEELRDEAIHLFISDVPKNVLGLLQACVLNYYEALAEWFDVLLADRVPLGMMTIVFDLSPERLDLSNAVMRRRLGKDATEYLLSLSKELDDEHEDLGRSSAFSVEIRYGLTLQKKAGDAVAVAFTADDGLPVTTLRLARDPSTDFPYRQTELLGVLAMALKPQATTSGDIQAVVAAHSVKKRPEWFYQGRVIGSPGQYSELFAQWFVSQARRDPTFLSKAREKHRALQAAARKATMAKAPR